MSFRLDVIPMTQGTNGSVSSFFHPAPQALCGHLHESSSNFLRGPRCGGTIVQHRSCAEGGKLPESRNPALTRTNPRVHNIIWMSMNSNPDTRTSMVSAGLYLRFDPRPSPPSAANHSQHFPSMTSAENEEQIDGIFLGWFHGIYCDHFPRFLDVAIRTSSDPEIA
jgi:hypothetical protein